MKPKENHAVYAEERQQAIVTQARAEGRVDVTALADGFAVTTETVRRDLTTLERQGLLKRVHGGAIPVERLGFEPGLASRDAVMVSEKERIAKAAVAELPPEGSILLDAGTTTARLGEVLPHDRELTVVTNGLPIAMALSIRPNITVITLGGRLRGRTMAAVDAPALDMLRDLYVDVAFIASNGVSVERGLTTADPAEAAVKKAMLATGRRRVLLADHSKLGNAQLSRFGGVADLDVVVTDTGLDPSLAAEIETAGPKVVRA